MTDIIFIVVILAILGAAGLYIYKAKKRGVKCIGCPAASDCGKRGGCSGCASCGGADTAGK